MPFLNGWSLRCHLFVSHLGASATRVLDAGRDTDGVVRVLHWPPANMDPRPRSSDGRGLLAKTAHKREAHNVERSAREPVRVPTSSVFSRNQNVTRAATINQRVGRAAQLASRTTSSPRASALIASCDHRPPEAALASRWCHQPKVPAPLTPLAMQAVPCNPGLLGLHWRHVFGAEEVHVDVVVRDFEALVTVRLEADIGVVHGPQPFHPGQRGP